jgi:hypothetical protein
MIASLLWPPPLPCDWSATADGVLDAAAAVEEVAAVAELLDELEDDVAEEVALAMLDVAAADVSDVDSELDEDEVVVADGEIEVCVRLLSIEVT